MPEGDISIWFDEKEEQNAKRQALNDGFENIVNGRVSPLKSTVNADWNDISTTQQQYYIGKAKQMFAATLSVISPGQEQQLWQSIRQDPFITEKESTTGAKRKYFDINSEPINVPVKAHNEAPSWQTKRQILSLFANDFSCSELQKLIPGLSKWRIDQARDHATKIGRGQTVPEKEIFRRRIDNAKVDHFLDYISRPQLLQDVAFGTKTLRLDSGEKIIIPAVVRTLIPSQIIEQYVCHSRQQGFEPAGEISLYRILDACSASVQQSLQDLDNITAEGTDAIDNGHGFIGYPKGRNVERALGPSFPCALYIHIHIITINIESFLGCHISHSLGLYLLNSTSPTLAKGGARSATIITRPSGSHFS